MTTTWTARLGTDIQPTTIQWLWPRCLARGKLSLLDGNPEMGKSLITVDLVARLSRGGPMPDGSPLPRPGTSLILSDEDEAEDTIRPRLEAAGADLSRVVFPRFDGGPPRFPDDTARLEDLIWEHAVELVVIDPLTAFLSASVAFHSDPSIRRVMSPFKQLAARTGAAVEMLRHLSKRGADRAIHRGLGSMGIVAACRTALLAAEHPTEQDLRILAPFKGNICARPPTLGYRIVQTAAGQPLVEWAGPVEVTADEAAHKPRPTAVRPRDRAIDWLKRELAAGPRKTAELYATAAEIGIPERTLDRAKAELPAHSHRTWDHGENRGEWYWYDRDAPWPDNAPFRKPFELAPLDPL